MRNTRVVTSLVVFSLLWLSLVLVRGGWREWGAGRVPRGRRAGSGLLTLKGAAVRAAAVYTSFNARLLLESAAERRGGRREKDKKARKEAEGSRPQRSNIFFRLGRIQSYLAFRFVI